MLINVDAANFIATMGFNAIDVPLTTRKMWTTIDLNDAALVLPYRWMGVQKKKPNVTNWYAARFFGRRPHYLHRTLLGLEHGQLGDHADRNTLNNRRRNLRPSDHSQNNVNRVSRLSSSGYRGVYKHYNRWKASIEMRGKQRHIGCFATAIEAAIAYDKAAVELHGEFAITNFKPR